MPNYQSIVHHDGDAINEVDPLLNDQDILSRDYLPIPDRSPSHKHRFFLFSAIIALGLLGVGSRHCYFRPDTTDLESFLLPAGSAGGRCRIATKENQCDDDLICCPGRFFRLSGPWLGKCATCCSDFDCIAQIEMPPPGKWGKHICDTSTPRHECRAYKNGKYSLIGKEGYPVWVPSETKDNSKEFQKINIKREIISDDPEDPPMEIAYYFDFNDQDEDFNATGISYNGTHITIPTYNKVHAGYSKSYKAFNESETGIVTSYFAVNDFSVVADYPKVDQVQKYHTLTFNGLKDTARGDYVRNLSAKQVKREPTFDRNGFISRAVAQVLALQRGKGIRAQVHANVDKALAWQVRRYVRDFNNTGVDKALTPGDPRWQSHSTKAKDAIGLAKNINFQREYLKSELHCNHLEYGVPGGGFTVDGTDDTVTIPLGVPITTFTGETVVSPSHYIGFGLGTYTAHYDDKNGIFQVFFQGFLNARMYGDAKFPGNTTGQGENSSGMFLGRVSKGDDYYVDPDKDGRGDELYQATKPEADRSRMFWPDEPDLTLWQRPYNQRCSSKALKSKFWAEIGNGSGQGNSFESLYQRKRLLQGLIKGMPCSTSWMQSDYGDDTHSFDLHEITVWGHTLMEIRPSNTKEMALAPWWNEWECFYHDKDRSLCH